MKTQKIFAILSCAILMVSLSGCFPFNLAQNMMQNNTNGGADGPTSVITTEPSERPTEETSDFQFDFDDFSNMGNSEESSEDPLDEYDASAVWFGYEDEDAMWLFFDSYAVLYEDATNYYVASFAQYYNEDAIQYIANDLAEFGLTESEQRESIGELYEGERYFCIVFEDVEVYENDTYVGPYEEDIIAYLGFEYKEDGTVLYDLLNMSTQEMVSFYTYEDTHSTGAPSEDTQRIGSAATGYVDVPADYYSFTDPATTAETIQYCDSSVTNIVTLTYYDNTDLTAETCAQAMLQNFQQDTAMDSSSVTGAMVELDGCEAYQIYGYYPADDIFLVIWFLDSPEDDYIHYVSVEFTSDHYDLFEMVENTYHVAY